MYLLFENNHKIYCWSYKKILIILGNHLKMRVTHDAHHQRDMFFQALFKLHLNSVGSAVKISEGKKERNQYKHDHKQPGVYNGKRTGR